MPLRFEANAGQWDERTRYVAHAGAATIAFGDDGATIALPAARPSDHDTTGPAATLRMKVAGGRAVAPNADDELSTRSNYFLGNVPARWRTDVPNYGRVTYRGVRDGVDLVFHGSGSQLEYDFVVAAGASPDEVALDIEGAESLSLSAEGELLIHTPAGDLKERPPLFYQTLEDGERKVISGKYRLQGTHLGFEVAAYDRARDLVIDPVVLLYSTYLGGSGEDQGDGMALDGNGAVYLTGYTAATFPTKSALQGVSGGSYDVFVAKLNATGTALVYSTYLGGSGMDIGGGIAVDAAGNAYVAGYTASANFPTQNALQPSNAGSVDAFVAKLDATGSALLYSTYVGGLLDDEASAVALDGSGNACVTGFTTSTDFPISSALQPSNGGGQADAFILKVNASGSALVYSTYFGGSSLDRPGGIAADAAGNAYVSGYTYSADMPTKNALQSSLSGSADAYVSKVDPLGALVFSTYLGGTGYDYGSAIAVGGNGNVYVTGSTQSTDFPTQNALQPALTNAFSSDAFVTTLNASGAALVYSTYLGGMKDEGGTAIVVDASDNVFVGGSTSSTDFPTVSAFQGVFGVGATDAFVVRFSPAGTIWWSTYLAGNFTAVVHGIATDGKRNAYVAGATGSTDFPTKTPIQGWAGSSDAFVTKLGWPTLGLAPMFPSVAPKGTKTFTCGGGSGAGFVYSLSINNSGGSINPSTGLYTAGPTASVTDTVQVADSDGDSAVTTVVVGPGVSISPANLTVPPKYPLTLSASGGSSVGWVWSLVTNNSGATINPSTGAYVAGGTPSVTDIVHVSDSLGNAADTKVIVGPGATIAPANPAVAPKGSVAFTATGGYGNGWVWSVPTNNSGATIGVNNGKYVAGAVGNVVDTVHVTDSLGNVANVNVSVGGGLAINPSSPSAPTKGTLAFTVTGGSGTGYAWSLPTNASGGTIGSSTGQYTAGTTGNVVDTVKVVDSLANSATEGVAVGPGLTITPPAASVLAGGAVGFAASGGSGNGYAWSFVANASGGTLEPNSGAYLAGSAGGTDVVQVADTLANTATATITVKAMAVDAGALDGSATADASDGSAGGGGTSTAPTDGCGCSTPGTTRGPAGYAALVVLAALVGVRLRSRRRRSTGTSGTVTGHRTSRR